MTQKNTPLTDEEVIRSYRDAEFRETLTSEQLQFAATHASRPNDYGAGGELSDADLESVAGGAKDSWSSGSCCSFCDA